MSVTVALRIPTGIFVPRNKGMKSGFLFGYVAQEYVIPEILPSSAPVVAEWQSYAPGRDFHERVVVRKEIESGEFYQRVGHRPVENSCYQIDDLTEQGFGLDRPWMNMPPCAKEYGENKRCIRAWNNFLSQPYTLLEDEIILNSKEDLSASQAAYFQYHAGRFVVIGDFLYRREDEPRLVITRNPTAPIFPVLNDGDMDVIEYLPLPALGEARKRFTALYPWVTEPEYWPFECLQPRLFKGNFLRDRIENFVWQFLEEIGFKTGGVKSQGFDEFSGKLDAQEKALLDGLYAHVQTSTEDCEYDMSAGKALLRLELTSALWSLTKSNDTLRTLREIIRADLENFGSGQGENVAQRRWLLH